MPTPVPWRSRWVRVTLVATLAGLLLYPLHVRYQNPDQDVPVLLVLGELRRGEWRPLTLSYPSAFTNLLRVGAEAAMAAGPLLGGPRTPDELFAAWCDGPWRFRVAARLVAVSAGVLSLVAVLGLGTRLGGPGTGVLAVALLGTSLMFVREHHHGMWDAPASGCAAAALWQAVRHVRKASWRSALGAGVFAGLAISTKYNLPPALLAAVTGALAGSGLVRRRCAMGALVVLAAVGALVATTPAIVTEPARVWSSLGWLATEHSRMLRINAGESGARFGEALRWGLGTPLLAAAAAGLVVTLRRDVRAVAPVLVFVAGYAGELATSPLVLNRYALPLAPPLAVLAATGVAAAPRRGLRLALGVALLALALPRTAAYLRLIAVEDTRAAAARWLAGSLPPGERLVLLCWAYAAPDIPFGGLLGFPGVPGNVTLPQCPRSRTVETQIVGPELHEVPERLRGAAVVTCEYPLPPLAFSATPPAAVRTIAADADLLAEFGTPTVPDGVRHEPFDMNFVPFVGAGALRQPGPWLRVWRVRPAPDRPQAPPAPLAPGP